MQQIALDMGLAPVPSLKGTIVGCNAAAIEHLRLWAESPTRAPVPTYLWGESGSGKSHLLLACAQAIESGGGKVGWLRAGEPEPPEFDPSWAAVLMDDVHHYGAVQQHAAFKWFVESQSRQRWVLAAGAQPVADLPLREDLRTRLGWGHVYQLQVLSDADRRAVLRQQADERGVFLKDDVMDFILVRFSRDLSSLAQLLDQLDRYALAQKRPITVPLVKAMLEQL